MSYRKQRINLSGLINWCLSDMGHFKFLGEDTVFLKAFVRELYDKSPSLFHGLLT